MIAFQVILSCCSESRTTHAVVATVQDNLLAVLKISKYDHTSTAAIAMSFT